MRPIEETDLPAILELNNAHEREIGRIERAGLEALLSVAAYARMHGEAFLIALDQDAPPQGPNHAWFLARYARFLYVDRVCVAERARKQGLGRALYDSALAFARAHDLPIVGCEVNLEPPNPGSDAFHAALGFVEAGRAHLPDRGKTVRYLTRSGPYET